MAACCLLMWVRPAVVVLINCCCPLLQVKAEAKRRALNMKFHGAKDHLDKSMHEYKVSAARLVQHQHRYVAVPGLHSPLAVDAAAV